MPPPPAAAATAIRARATGKVSVDLSVPAGDFLLGGDGRGGDQPGAAVRDRLRRLLSRRAQRRRPQGQDQAARGPPERAATVSFPDREDGVGYIHRRLTRRPHPRLRRGADRGRSWPRRTRCVPTPTSSPSRTRSSSPPPDLRFPSGRRERSGDRFRPAAGLVRPANSLPPLSLIVGADDDARRDDGLRHRVGGQLEPAGRRCGAQPLRRRRDFRQPARREILQAGPRSRARPRSAPIGAPRSGPHPDARIHLRLRAIWDETSGASSAWFTPPSSTGNRQRAGSR